MFPPLDSERLLVLASGMLIGSSYFHPAINKLQLRWQFRENLAYYVPWSYLRGWQGQLDTEIVVATFEFVSALNPVLLWGTILIEASGIVFLWRKRLFAVIIPSIILLHISIFLVSGIIFKQWIIVLLAFAALVYRVESTVEGSVFSRQSAAIVTIGILLAPMIFSLGSLAWYQTNYDRFYSVEVIDSDGTVHEVSWSEFEPYQRTFRQNRLAYVDNSTVLPGACSTRDYQTLVRLKSATSPEDIMSLRESYGVNKYDPSKAAEFDTFIRRFVNLRTSRVNHSLVWTSGPLFPHLYYDYGGGSLPPDNNYTTAQIRRTQYLYTDGRPIEVNSTIVRKIDLSSEGRFHTQARENRSGSLD